MATEQSPLLVNSSAPRYTASGTDTQLRTDDDRFYLDHHARALLARVRASIASTEDGEPRPNLDDERAVLPLSLYALSLLRAKQVEQHATNPSIRAILAENVVLDKMQAHLNDEVEQLLDNTMRPLSVLDEDLVEGVDLEEIIWKSWDIDHTGIKISAAGLLLRPSESDGSLSPFLSHPLLRQVFAHTWKHGIPPRSKHVWLKTLQKRLTPRRAHFISLLSYIVFCCLAIVLAIRPRKWISPYANADEPTPISAIEVVWSIWSISTITDSLRGPLTRSILLLPSALVLLLAISHQPTTAYTFLTLSIPNLFILLLLPYAPSLPTLHPPFIPLSRLLLHTIHKSLRAASLVLPLILPLFAIFTYSMNGDIFRGLNVNDWSVRVGFGVTISELGIAPFEARVWIFVTMVILGLMGVVLASARVGQVGGERDGVRWKGGVRADDDWEVEYGVDVARMARRDFGRMIRGYIGSRYTQAIVGRSEGSIEGGAALNDREWVIARMVPPLNLLILPLDLAITTTKDPSVRQLLLSERELLGALVMAPLCYIASFIGV